MTFDPGAWWSDSLQLRASRCFQALIRQTGPHQFQERGAEPNLGGRLLYTGEANADSWAIVVAGNVAGCATLAATADSSTQKQLIREGVIDFLVTSLDEALRILKNEIRKRNAVAVCVAARPEPIEREMRARGVQPDMVFAGTGDEPGVPVDFGAGSLVIRSTEPDPGLAFVTWQVSESAARWMPKLDSISLDLLPNDAWEHRWIRLSPRYCGRAALDHRAMHCAPHVAQEIISRFRDSVQSGEIGAEVAMHLASGDESKVFRITPGGEGKEQS